MILHARSGDTVLDHTVVTVPSPVNVSTPQKPEPLRLELVVKGNADTPVHVDRIEIALPHGPGETDLTTTTAATIKTTTDRHWPPGQNWNTDAVLDDGLLTVTFTARRPIRADSLFAVTLILYDFLVNEATGTADVVVTEWTSADGIGEPVPATTRFPIDKWPADFTFANFRPTKPTVDNGERVTLSWERSRGPSYTLYWDDDSKPVDNDSSWLSHPLERTTGFMLVAVDGTGPSRRTYALTTAVTVTEPNLLVGNLDVNGVTRIQGPRQAFPLPASGTSQYYKARTDGTLVGYLAGRSGAPGATLAATVYRAGLNEYTMRFTSENPTDSPPDETPVTVPVPQDAEVLLHFAGQRGDTLDLVWLPCGAGAFEVMPR